MIFDSSRQFDSRSIDLARHLSLASRITPALMRRFRVEFIKNSSPGIEAELWFGSLVEVRTARSILMAPDVAAAFRQDLVNAGNHFIARNLLKKTEHTRPPLVRLEEELIWLGVLFKHSAMAENLVEKLRQIIKAIADGGRSGLARWALGAIPRIPELHDLPETITLRALAESQLFDGRITFDPGVGVAMPVAERALLLSNLGRVRVGVRLMANQLFINEPPLADDRLIDVPATIPRQLTARWQVGDSPKKETLSWYEGRSLYARPVVSGNVSLSTLADDHYEVSDAVQALDIIIAAVKGFFLTGADPAGPLGVRPAWLFSEHYALAALSTSLGETSQQRHRAGDTLPLRFPFLEGREIEVKVVDLLQWPKHFRATKSEHIVLLQILTDLPVAAKPPKFRGLPLETTTGVAFSAQDGIGIEAWGNFFVRPSLTGPDIDLEGSSFEMLERLPRWCGSPLFEPLTGAVLGIVYSREGRVGCMPWQQLEDLLSPFLNRKPVNRATVLVAYSHQDEVWKDQLVHQLRVLEIEGTLSVWDDRKIAAGDAWRAEIAAAMEHARAAVLLISADFLISGFIRGTEVPRLLQRRDKDGLRIIPLIVRPCPWRRVPWLAEIQGRPTDGRPLAQGSPVQIEKDLSALAEEIADLLQTAGTSRRATAGSGPVLDTGRLPIPGPHFVGRDAELARLDAAWEDPSTHVLTLVAFGGVGKSALVARWMDRMAADNWRGAARVLDWSFYSQGSKDQNTSAEPFIDHALRFFGDPDPKAGSLYDRGARLAYLIRKERSLLVLDGIEPLQYPPGRPEIEGRLKDPGLAALLKGLAAGNPGLCLVTTRERIADLAGSPSTAPQISLEELEIDAAVALLRQIGVDGRESELRAAAEDFKRHALTLTLLGNFLRRAHGGDIRKRREIDLHQADRKQGGRASRVIGAYARWLGEGPELAILRLLGLFDRPAEAAALKALRAAPPIPGLTEPLVDLSNEDWYLAAATLRDQGVLAAADPREPETLDAHPLVRASFSEELESHRPDAWQEGNRRLYEHLRQAAPDLPDTLEAMQPLYTAVVHGCRAGRQQEAMTEVYKLRILRGNEFFSWKKLGIFGSELTALAGFFDRPWSQPSARLTAADQAFVLNGAAFVLRALGRLAEAVEPVQAGLEARVTQENWKDAAVSASNLSELILTLGDVPRAVAFGEQSIELADRSGDAFQRMARTATWADALHQAGQWEESAVAFREAEAIQADLQPEYPRLYSLPGFRHCDLLLSWAEPEVGSTLDGLAGMDSRPEEAERFRQAYREVLERGQEALRIVEKNHWLLDIALDHLTLGRAYLGMALTAPHPAAPGEDRNFRLTQAAEQLARAVDGLRRAGQEDFLPRGLLARAALWRFRSDFTGAAADLTEALEIAERGPMRLHECDVHLEWARLSRDQGDLAAARRHVARTRELVEETGYRRREREVRWLVGALSP